MVEINLNRLSEGAFFLRIVRYVDVSGGIRQDRRLRPGGNGAAAGRAGSLDEQRRFAGIGESEGMGNGPASFDRSEIMFDGRYPLNRRHRAEQHDEEREKIYLEHILVLGKFNFPDCNVLRSCILLSLILCSLAPFPCPPLLGRINLPGWSDGVSWLHS